MYGSAGVYKEEDTYMYIQNGYKTQVCVCIYRGIYEPLPKLLVCSLIASIVIPQIIPYMNPKP